jgi:N-acetylmuramoyl-L-alanine amidase
VRRSLTGVFACLAFSTTFLVPPAHAAPPPRLVEGATESIPMGSLVGPAVGALVRRGTGAEAGGIPQTPPALSVLRTGTKEFSLVGATWTDDPAVTDTVVRVRVQSAAGTWGAWTEMEAHESGADETASVRTSIRGGTEPVWTGPSRGVEAEVVTRSGAHPRDVHLDLVDAGTGPVDATLVPPVQNNARGTAAAPAIHPRKDWGADERLRKGKPRYARTIKAATLHHTVNTNAYTAQQVPAMIRAIYRYHVVSRGWGDIGYNVLVDKFGRVWEGRYGGLKSTVIGAHARSFNKGTVGIALLGNYDSGHTTAPMIAAAEAFIAWKFSLFHVDPTATTRLKGGGKKVPTIFGHRDAGKTACPGRYGYARLPEIRAAVDRRLATAPTSS